MPSFSFWIDLPLAFLGYFLGLWGTLAWIFRSNQAVVARTARTWRRVASRLAQVSAVIVASCYLANIPIWSVAAGVTVLLLLGILGGPLAIPAIPVVVLGGLLKEYVLGFPELVLTLPNPAGTVPDPSRPNTHHIGQTAVTRSPLRPQGEVELEGRPVPAISTSGTFIPAGSSVVVTGWQGDAVRVREARDDERVGVSDEGPR